MSTLTRASRVSVPSPLKRLINRHPLVAYFVIAFVGTWLTVLPVLLSRRGFGFLPYAIPFWPLQILGTLTGPLLAALIVTTATSGKAGIVQLLSRLVQWRLGLGWYLLAILGYPALYLVSATTAFGLEPLRAFVQHWPLFFSVYLVAIVWNHLLGAIGEEAGWRGFALPRLQEKYGPMRGTLILGTLHGLWHLPAFFVLGGLGPFNPVGFVLWMIVVIATTIVWTWVFNNAQGSILIAVLLHSASNAAIDVTAALNPVYLHKGGLGFFALTLLFVLLIILFTRGRLSYKPERVAKPIEASQSSDIPLVQA